MRKPVSLWIALFSISALYGAETVYSAVNPEKDSVRISGGLRPYSDADWTLLAGSKSSERYEISRGDTLWDISARLFGEARVWPKIWEINNTEILNPHMIEPRMLLVFNTGSGMTLPSITLKSTGTMTVKNHYSIAPGDHPGSVWDERTPMPSREWKNLARQSWENVRVDLPANIDKDGFDSKNRVYLTKPATGVDLPHFIACKPVEPLATVVGTRSISNFVDRGSEVTLKLSGTTPLEVGKMYTLVDPEPLTVESKPRTALSYAINGRVKILGLQNGTFIGEIQAIKNPVVRGSLVVEEIKRVDKMAPVAGATKVKGSLIADRRTGAFMSGQNKWVYIDRGTKDGVDRGMIFRIFQNQDPKNGKRLTSGDVFVQGDVQILQGCENFSVGLFIWSRGEVPELYEGALISDVSDEKVRFYFNGSASDLETGEVPALQAPSGIIDAPKPAPKEAIVGPSENPDMLTPAPPVPEKPAGEADDWLDKLDNNQELKSEEENELQQLEKFQENQAKQEVAPADTPPPPEELAPSDLPPPPADALPAPSAGADLPPPPPDSEFPSEEPVVDVPTSVVKTPAKKSAAAPKAKPTAAPAEPVDENSVDGLTPL